MAIKKGIYAASMSIFNQDLSLDVDSTIKHSERLIKEGLHGAIFFGSTGMAQLISSNEKKKLIEKLKGNKDINDAFGKEVINSYIKLKNSEINQFKQKENFDKTKAITRWERDNTLDC